MKLEGEHINEPFYLKTILFNKTKK